MKKANKNKKEIVKEEKAEPVEQGKLKEDIEKYLQITADNIKSKVEDEETIKKIKKSYDEELENLKILRKDQKTEELYDYVISIVNHSNKNSASKKCASRY